MPSLTQRLTQPLTLRMGQPRTSGAVSIGGIAVGDAGGIGTIYDTYVLSDGDDFNVEPTIYRANDLTGRYKTSTATRGRRSNNTEAYQYYWDKYHWGYLDGDFYAVPGINPFSVSASTLAITCRIADAPTIALHDPTWVTPQGYTSGHLASSESLQYRYGIVEFRAKMPAGDGEWAALWTLNNELPWPGGCEHGWEFHGNGNYRPYLINEAGTLVYAPDFTDIDVTAALHTFSIRWWNNAGTATLQWFVDGNFIASQTGATVALMDRTRFFIMNLALSTIWNGGGGAPSAGQFPSVMQVDWWRYWKPAAAAAVTAIAPSVSYPATRSVAFSQVIPTFFSGNDSETVNAVWEGIQEPGNGGFATPGNINLPSGMTWTLGTRTLAWDVPVGAGRLLIRFTGWNAAGGKGEVRHVTLDLAPQAVGGSLTLTDTETIPASTVIDLSALFDSGNLAAIVTATLSNGNPLPAWMAWTPATRTLARTPPLGSAGTVTVRLTCTSLAGSLIYDVVDTVSVQVVNFTDDANRANSNLVASGNWTRLDGTDGWGMINTNQFQANTTDALGAAYVSPNLGTAATYSYVQANLLNSGPASFIAVRVTDRSNFLGVRWGSATTIQVYQRVTGTLTLLATYNVNFGSTKVIRLEDYGGTFDVKVDGASQTPASGSETISAGPPASTRQGMIMRTAIQQFADNYEAGVV